MSRSSAAPRIRWSKIARKMIRSRLKLGAVSRRFGLLPIVGNPLQARRRSDTLFILGSGSSINDISAAEWEEIRRADSLGFNFWLVHDFVPSFYVFEPTDAGTPPHECLIANLHQRADDYRDVPILIKDGERHRRVLLESFIEEMPVRLRTHLRMSLDFEIPGDADSLFADALQFLERLGILRSSRMPVPRKRASVFYLTVLALRAGYRKIVLCGIDLNNTDYFYESRRAELEAKGRAVPPPVPRATAHKTDDPRFGEVTISVALQALDREILKPAGIELYVAFRSSGLYPALPSYFER